MQLENEQLLSNGTDDDQEGEPMIDYEPLLSESPFLQDFPVDHDLGLEITNPFFNKDALDIVHNQWMPLYPLWSALGSGTYYTNATVESWFR